MSRNIVSATAGASVGASAIDTPVSKAFAPADLWNIQVAIVLSAVAQTNGITFKLKDSYDNGASYFDVGSESQVALVKKTAASATDLTHGTNTIAITAHGFVTGDQIIFRAGTVPPTGFVDGTTYFVVRSDADSFKLASTLAEALAGTAIDFTTNGTGTQAFYKAVYQIRMERDDATDRAQMPLFDNVVVVANSGASDSCTVSAVYVTE